MIQHLLLRDRNLTDPIDPEIALISCIPGPGRLLRIVPGWRGPEGRGHRRGRVLHAPLQCGRRDREDAFKGSCRPGCGLSCVPAVRGLLDALVILLRPPKAALLDHADGTSRQRRVELNQARDVFVDWFSWSSMALPILSARSGRLGSSRCWLRKL